MSIAPGDRTHIPDSLRPIHNVIGQQLNQLKQATPVRIISMIPSSPFLTDGCLHVDVTATLS
jgi:hypothetical protein